MELYEYELIGFDPEREQNEESDIDDETLEYPVYVHARCYKNAVVMPNAIYAPGWNYYEVVPIQSLGLVIRSNTILFHTGKPQEQPNSNYCVYLPYRDFKKAVQIFVRVLKRSGFPIHAASIDGSRSSKIHNNKTEITSDDIAFLKKYDDIIGPRE